MYRNKHGASNSIMLCHGNHIKTNVDMHGSNFFMSIFILSPNTFRSLSSLPKARVKARLASTQQYFGTINV